MRRKPPATAEEVMAAVDKLCESRGGPKLNSAMSIAGIVAQYRGCPDTWPGKDNIAQYVSITSVRAVLAELVAEGKVFPVPSNHWSLTSRSTGKFTYYVNKAKRQQLTADKVQRENVRRAAVREQEVNRKLRKRFASILDELNEEWEQANPPIDWETRW